MQTVLRDVLIAAGQIDKYYESAPANLWRAKRKSDKGALFGLADSDKVLSNGKVRSADITIEIRHGVKWVSCKEFPRGISTFDAPNTFRGLSWDYYKIPKGTQLPHGLAIVKDNYNSRMMATHYTVAPAFDMPLSQFRGLLDKLALLVRREVA
jgi:hypothetical protein